MEPVVGGRLVFPLGLASGVEPKFSGGRVFFLKVCPNGFFF